MKKIILIAILIFINTSQAVTDEKRIALIIGNANYSEKIGQLHNPINDATDMASALKDLGFEVISGINLERREMLKKIDLFEAKLRSGQPEKNIGLFYYAGHGMEIEGENYLLPVDADIDWQDQVSDEGIKLQRIIKPMNQSNDRMNIVILDACRNNPLPKKPSNIGRSISTGGWSKIQNVAKGMFIAYGTSEGRQSSDGSGRNGVFTKNLLKNIKTKGLLLEQVFKKTREGVLKDSNQRQLTDQTNQTVGDFYFNTANITNSYNSLCINKYGEECDNKFNILDINDKEMILEFIKETIKLASNNDFKFWDRVLYDGESIPLEVYELYWKKKDINILNEPIKYMWLQDSIIDDYPDLKEGLGVTDDGYIKEFIKVFEFYKKNKLDDLIIDNIENVENSNCIIFGYDTDNCKVRYMTLTHPKFISENIDGRSAIYIFDNKFYWSPNDWEML